VPPPPEPGPPNGATFEVAAFAATHGESLYRAALLLTGASAPAQDLVQDTYTRLLPAWRKIEDKEAARAYAARIMTRLYWRQRRRRWNYEHSLQDRPEAQMAASLDIDDRIALRDALSRLAPSQRTVIVLRYSLDLSVRQTADAMHCSEGNVKSQTSRALDRLRELLSETEPVRRTP
jgi:RNA polymerase sigma-70 factor (sigma-E family)